MPIALQASVQALETADPTPTLSVRGPGTSSRPRSPPLSATRGRRVDLAGPADGAGGDRAAARPAEAAHGRPNLAAAGAGGRARDRPGDGHSTGARAGASAAPAHRRWAGRSGERPVGEE